MHQCEHMVGEAGRIGVVLFDSQVRFVVQQAIEHIGGIAHADVDHLDTERRVLIGNMRVEQPPRLRAVLRVDVAGALGLAAHFEALTVRGRRGAIAPVLRERVAELGIDKIGQRRRIGLVADVPGLQPRQLSVTCAGT